MRRRSRKAAEKTGVDLRGVGLADENGTVTLRVNAFADPKGDVRNLTEFRDLLWGSVRQVNRTSPSVAVGFFEVLGPDGEQLVFEVNDFIIPWTHTYRVIDYPSEE